MNPEINVTVTLFSRSNSKRFRLEKENDARKKRKRCKVGGEIGDIDEERENDENNKDNKTKKN